MIVQVVTEIPEGLESGWHTHPGEEVGYISRAPSA
jgi:quercetin dioxygenase-like cupin family protein